MATAVPNNPMVAAWLNGTDMESAIDVFTAMMRDRVSPELRRLGFKGSGQSFWLPSERQWASLGFQKSTSSSREVVKFTVNVTVVNKSVWTEARKTLTYLPERPSPNTTYGRFAWHERIGKLLPAREDRWWLIASGPEADAAATEVLEAVRTYVVPEMRRQIEP